jgi:uncharacterized protein (TIGR00255 family)
MAVNSMTGYGKGIAEKNGIKITVELKSVNHRFLDLTIKLPKMLSFSEDVIRNTLKSNFNRGHIDVFVNYEDNRENKTEIAFDYDLINAYIEAGKKISSDLFIQDDLTTSKVLMLQDVAVEKVKEEDEQVLLDVLKEALDVACEKMSIMRAAEGVLMQNDVLSKISNITALISKIEAKAPMMVQEHFEKVRVRVQEMLKDVEIDEARLLSEVALYADKVCVDEEIQRLKSHIEHFNEIMSKGGIVGKQLDFIVQEMNREANTCGSKCNNIEISNNVIALKNEIEKVREQIQNIE